MQRSICNLHIEGSVAHCILLPLQERSIVSNMAGTTRDAIDTGGELLAVTPPSCKLQPGLRPLRHPSLRAQLARIGACRRGLPAHHAWRRRFLLPCPTQPADVTLKDGRKFKLVDTAGVRKRTAVASSKDGAEASSCRAAVALRRAGDGTSKPVC